MKSPFGLLVIVLCITTTISSDNLQEHVIKQMILGEDKRGFSMKRVYEIYSKATGQRVQVRGRRVDANGVSGDKNCKLEISSISFGGRITIRSVATGRYICMGKRGKLVGRRKKKISNRCTFTEKIGENYFDTFTNVRRSNWYLAFQPNGRPKKGPRTSAGQTEVMFLKRPIEQKVVTSTPSPSAVKEETWTGLEQQIRMQLLSGRDVDISGGRDVSQSTLSQESTSMTLAPKNPPDIQKEIDFRRSLAQKFSSEASLHPPPPTDVTKTTSTPVATGTTVPSDGIDKPEKENRKTRKRTENDEHDKKQKRKQGRKHKKRIKKHKKVSKDSTKNVSEKGSNASAEELNHHKPNKAQPTTTVPSVKSDVSISHSSPTLPPPSATKPSRRRRKKTKSRRNRSKPVKSKLDNSSRRRTRNNNTT